MKIRDKCFFYHSGKEKKIVGIVEIIKEHFLDKTDQTHKFVSVAVRALTPFKKPIQLTKPERKKPRRPKNRSSATLKREHTGKLNTFVLKYQAYGVVGM